MALSQGSDFWDERYRALATLKLPGPALVVDVRQGSDHEPPLIWNLATELDDFTQEMELKHIYRWRRLSHFLALFKLNPLPKSMITATYDYVLTDPRGRSQMFQGQAEIAEALREQVGLVRGNRFSAINDREQQFPTESSIDPNRPTVYVYFVADANDPQSLTSAAFYAEWLKQAENNNDGQWNWRSPQIMTLVICLNVDRHKHSPQILAHHFQYSSIPFALDKIILLYNYGDNDVPISKEMQTDQIELILYVLLLADLELFDNSASPMDEYSDSIGQENRFDYLPVNLIGISSLEYSARWGTRWLDYGLVERICEILLEANPKQAEKTFDLLKDQKQAEETFNPLKHHAWNNWQTEIEHFIFNELEANIPELNALYELVMHFTPPEGKKIVSKQLESAQTLALYYIKHLQNLKEAKQVILDLTERLMQDLQGNQLTKKQEGLTRLEEQWQALLDQTTQLSADLLLPDTAGEFSSARLVSQGLLPRAQQSAIMLSNTICDIETATQDLPDLDAGREQVEHLTGRMKHSKSFLDRKKQSQQKQLQQELTEQIRRDVIQIQHSIVAQIQLVLLEKVGLYNPNGKSSEYQSYLQQLIKTLRKVATEAGSMRNKAYDRLQASLSQVQTSSVQNLVKLDYHSRIDLLDWSILDTAFEQLSEKLAKPDSSLPLLGYWLLCLLNGADPDVLMQKQLQSRPQASGPTTFEQEEIADKQTIDESGILLMAILLASKQVQISTTSIQSLLKRYMTLTKSLNVEPSTFINIIELLQRNGRPLQMRQGQKNALNFAVRLKEPLELLLSTWINSGYIDQPPFNQTLAHNALFTRMPNDQFAPDAIFADLRRRNILPGYASPMLGAENSYLLFPGDVNNHFVQEIDLLYKKQSLKILPFPDIEKLVYLRIHHMVYPLKDDPSSDAPLLSSPGE